jgi:hypothetical protein
MEDKILENSDVGALPLSQLKERWSELMNTKISDDLREKKNLTGQSLHVQVNHAPVKGELRGGLRE